MSVEELNTAMHEGDEERFYELLEEVDIDRAEEHWRHPIDMAESTGNPTFVRELLERGLDPDAGDPEGLTPLYDALQMDRPEVAKLLIEAGANPNATLSSGNGPLHEAAHRGHHEAAAMLIERGADPTRENEYGHPPISRIRDHIERVEDDEVVERYREVLTDAQLEYVSSGPDPAGLEAGHERVPVEEVEDVAEWTWEELVPPSGQADTVQGELRRAVGRLRSEAYRNGNINWSENYELLLDFLETHLCGEPFDEATVEQTRADIESLRGGHINDQFNDDIYDRLTDRVVEFCEHHPELIEKEHDDDLGI